MNKNRFDDQPYDFWCHKEICELVHNVRRLPSSFAIPLMQKIGDLVVQARIQHFLAESTNREFSDLKWEMTCLKFDLDLTRKERDEYFKRLLD